MTESDDKSQSDNSEEHKEPSLGPACLVFVILSLAVFCAICAFGSFFMFRDQYPLAAQGITVELIPWIEVSQLEQDDKDSIIRQLNEILPKLNNREFDKQQMSRLRSVLQDNPVLMWGAVQQIKKQAPQTDLNETELQALERLTQRLMKMATDRILSRNDLEFTIQNCSRQREDKLGLAIVDELTTEQIREFMERAEQLAKKNGVPNTTYEKSPGEAFAILLESALNVDVIPVSPAVR